MADSGTIDKAAKIETVVALGKALHSVGQPAHRVEALVCRASETLGLWVHAFCLPTGLLLSFDLGDDGTGMNQSTRILRTPLSAVDLERLTKVARVGNDLISGSITPPEARRRTDLLMQAPPRWTGLSTVAAYVFSAAAFSVFFKGGQFELMVAVAVGLAVGVLAVLMRKIRTSSRLFELTAATTAAVIAVAADSLLGHFQDWVPLASGLIILLPGISLVDSLDELAHGHLAAGGARMAGVGVAFLALTFGTVLGEGIAGYVPDPNRPVAMTTQIHNSGGRPTESAPENAGTAGDSDGATAAAPEAATSVPSISHHPGHEPVASHPLPSWAIVPALIAVAAGSMIRFRSRPVDFFTGLLGSTVALTCARWGTYVFGPFGGPFLAAFALGTTGRLYSRWKGQAAELVTIPGIALIVPGSVGVRSVAALLSEDTDVGIDTAFHMFLIAMAIVAGLLFSNSIIGERIPQPKK